MNTQMQTAGSVNMPVMALGGIGLVVSLAMVMTALMAQGHSAFGTTNDGVAWGLAVAVYLFFVLTSTGLTFIASLALVLGFKQFYPIAKRCVWLAVATLIAGFASLAFELGHPFRMLWAIPLSFQVSSAINWMGVLYVIYLALLLLKFRRVNDGDWESGRSRNLGIAAFVAVIAAHGTLGLVFGMMAMRPFWFGGQIPLYFLATAFLSGVAFAVLITYVAYGFSQEGMPPPLKALMTGAMPKVFAAALAVAILFVAFRTITGLWSNADGLQVFERMVGSPWFHIELWVGMVLPLVLLLMADTRNQAGTQIACALLAIVALAIGRYEYIVGGQLVPLFKGAWMGEFAEYTPTTAEWMVTLLAVSLMLVIYAAGEKMLNLSAEPGTDRRAP